LLHFLLIGAAVGILHGWLGERDVDRPDARVTVVPVDGSWKIRSIGVLDEKRLR
jgi:hypothetical protein